MRTKKKTEKIIYVSRIAFFFPFLIFFLFLIWILDLGSWFYFHLYLIVSPLLITPVTLHHILNKPHAPDAFFYYWKIQHFFCWLFTIEFMHERKREIFIDVTERFEITFRMTSWSATILNCETIQSISIISSRPQHLHRLVQLFYKKCVRFLLCPFNATLLTIQSNLKCIFFTCCNLACHQYARCSTIVLQ